VISLLGFFAAALSTCSLVPQVVRSIRTRSTGDLAWAYLLAMVTGAFAWLGYGIALADPAVISANAVSAVLSTAILITKLRGHRTAPGPVPVELPVAEPSQ